MALAVSFLVLERCDVANGGHSGSEGRCPSLALAVSFFMLECERWA